MKNEWLIPSLLVTQVYFPYCEHKNETINILKDVSKLNFYQAIEIDCHYTNEESLEIGEIIKKNEWIATQWLTSLIDKNNLDLSSIDEQLRQKSVKEIIDKVEMAAKMNVKNIAFISGPMPDESLKEMGLEQFYKSLVEITDVAKAHFINVLIEPLDHSAHKKKILGTTKETIKIIKQVREKNDNIYFAFDTAHAALNRENIEEAIEQAFPFMDQLHFSNAILDSTHEQYGDNHIPIIGEGFLTKERMKRIVTRLNQYSKKYNKKMRVSIEVKGKNDQKLHENEKEIRQLLNEVLIDG